MAVADDFSRPEATAPAYDRQPPQDVAAEQSVLGGMLMSKDAIADVVEVLHGTDFYRPAHQVIFDCILDLYGRGEPADAITVAAELNRTDQLSKMGGAVYLHTLIASTPTAANAGYYAAIVAEQAVLRRLVEAGTRVVQLGYGAAGGKGDVDDIVDRAQQEIYDVTEKRMSEDYSRLEDVLQPTMDELDAIASRGGVSRGVPTGIRDLDELTNGLQAGQMIVIAARPGVGKALALDTPIATPSGWTTMGEVARRRPGHGLRRPADDGRRRDRGHDRPSLLRGALLGRLGDRRRRPAPVAHRDPGQPEVRQAARVGYNGYRNQQTFAEVRTTEEIARTVRCATKDARLNHSVTNAAAAASCPRPTCRCRPTRWVCGSVTAPRRRRTTPAPTPRSRPTSRPRACVVADHGRRCGMRCGCPSPGRGRTARRARCAASSSCRRRPRCRPAARPAGARSGPPAASGAGLAAPTAGAPSAGLVAVPGVPGRPRHRQGLLRTLGVLGDKHIPTAYLRASVAQRRALLAGLLDTDGTVAPSGVVQFARDQPPARRGRAGTHRRPRPPRADEPTKRVRGPQRGVLDLLHADVQHRRRGLPARAEEARCTRSGRADLHRPRRPLHHRRPADRRACPCGASRSTPRTTCSSPAAASSRRTTRRWGSTSRASASVRHHQAACIFSLEMSKHEITMRLLSAEAKVPLHHMRAGTLSDEDWSKLARRMGEVADAPLYIDDSPNMTMMEIRAKARRLKQRNDLKLVVIDYLQLMTSGKRVESRQQEVSEFSRALKLLAKELEVPVIAMSQLNRGSEQRQDKKPMLSDLRESGSIEQDADMVMMIHREDMYEKESPRAGEADIMLVKHRNGPTANVTVAFQGHYSRFVDMAN